MFRFQLRKATFHANTGYPRTGRLLESPRITSAKCQISFETTNKARGLHASRVKNSIRSKQEQLRENFALGYVPPVRILGPTLWCLIVAGGIYLGCAAYEVRQDVKEIERRRLIYSPITFEKVQESGRFDRIEAARRPLPPLDLLHPLASFKDLSGPTQTFTTVAILNTGLYAFSRLPVPSLFYYFCHVPAGSRNFTLLTSMFGHSGLLHLGLNMYALFNFGPPVANSYTFEGSGPHMSAFYLSAGLIASLTHHISASWTSGVQRMRPALGASGAIMALLGGFAVSYPDAQIGIIGIPIYFPASAGLAGLLAFETFGMFRGIPGIGIAHGAHLGGLLVGIAYFMGNGKKYLWAPARRVAFNWMRRLKMI